MHRSTRISPEFAKTAIRILLFPLVVFLLAASCEKSIRKDDRYEVVRVFPHDPAAFTQGLAYEDGVLYEGTGLRGKSGLRKVELETGKLIQRIGIDDKYFGEGIAIVGDRLVQLTWKSKTGFVYDKETFERIARFSYSSEGWGLAFDGERLVMSDGTSVLRFLDPVTFNVTGRIKVTESGRPVTGLNELEVVKGRIYANVWRTDRIVRISPATGAVTGAIDLSGLLNPSERPNPDQVLNGIAYDPEGDRLFVTGKWWPKLFEIRIVPAG